jgi:hypothetical protein
MGTLLGFGFQYDRAFWSPFVSISNVDCLVQNVIIVWFIYFPAVAMPPPLKQVKPVTPRLVAYWAVHGGVFF